MLRTLSAATAALTLAAAVPVAAQPADVKTVTRSFLDAYARGDRAAVLAVLDPSVVVYGSDVAEVFRGPAEVERLIADDQRLWGGAASIGEMRNLAVAEGRDLTVLTFDAPFAVGGRPPVPVRFSMAWRKTPQGWRLVQSANAVPTTGQSAAELLKAGR